MAMSPSPQCHLRTLLTLAAAGHGSLRLLYYNLIRSFLIALDFLVSPSVARPIHDMTFNASFSLGEYLWRKINPVYYIGFLFIY